MAIATGIDDKRGSYLIAVGVTSTAIHTTQPEERLCNSASMLGLTKLPYIPQEVAENIIDEFSRDIRSLSHCALTCQRWHPRARYHLMTSIRVQSREDLFSIRDYISSNPWMSSAVRSLYISPGYTESKALSLLEAVSVLLLSRLPNLRSFGMRHSASMSLNTRVSGMPLSFHAHALIWIRTYLHVEELSLGPVRFRTGGELARFLVALPRLQRLECTSLPIVDQKNPWVSSNGMTRLRDSCRRLSEVTVRRGIHILMTCGTASN